MIMLGEKGQLCVTNLRLIWLSHKDQKTNLSMFPHIAEYIHKYRISVYVGDCLRHFNNNNVTSLLF